MKPAIILFAASIAIISQSALADCSPELNAQLVEAHARTAATKARLEHILRERRDIPSVTIFRLRTQYLDLVARERIFADRYGADYAETVRLRAQRQEVQRDIDDEMIRIALSAKNDYEAALAGELSIRKAHSECLDDSHTNQIIR